METNAKIKQSIHSFNWSCFHNQLMQFSQPLHENTTNIRFSLIGKTFVGWGGGDEEEEEEEYAWKWKTTWKNQIKAKRQTCLTIPRHIHQPFLLFSILLSSSCLLSHLFLFPTGLFFLVDNWIIFWRFHADKLKARAAMAFSQERLREILTANFDFNSHRRKRMIEVG